MMKLGKILWLCCEYLILNAPQQRVNGVLCTVMAVIDWEREIFR
jgi:hypothetical protein